MFPPDINIIGERQYAPLFELFWRGQISTRSQAARELHLSRPTASAYAEALLTAGMLRSHGVGESSGGKPPELLSVNDNAFSTIGIDIGYAAEIRGVLLSAAGDIIKREKVPSGTDFPGMVDAICALCRALGAESEIFPSGVGIAVSGLVDPATRQIIRSANFDLAGKPLAAELAAELAMPVVLDNRSRMSARAEQFSGAARQASDFLLLSLGKSIGSAIFIDKKLYTGQNGAAGEIRDFPVPAYNGIATQTLEEALRRETLLKYAVSMPRAAEICACGIRQLLAVFDLNLLVLSGSFDELGEEFRSALELYLHHAPAGNSGCRVVLSEFGSYSAACGGALSVVETHILRKGMKP